jgi:hypothetical protein
MFARQNLEFLYIEYLHVAKIQTLAKQLKSCDILFLFNHMFEQKFFPGL